MADYRRSLWNRAGISDENTGSVVFPINAVWKRIEPTLETGKFFQPMWEAVKNHVEKHVR